MISRNDRRTEDKTDEGTDRHRVRQEYFFLGKKITNNQIETFEIMFKMSINCNIIRNT